MDYDKVVRGVVALIGFNNSADDLSSADSKVLATRRARCVGQQAELRNAEASRRLGALNLRMSSIQDGLGEHNVAF